MDELRNKMWYRHTTGQESALKRKEILIYIIYATGINPEDTMLRQIRQSQKD